MPRVNLSINQDMYERIKQQADIQGISVNNMIYNQLQKQYGRDEFDYIVALDCLKQEAMEKDGFFYLWELPTFKDIDGAGAKESPEQIRARLGKMFHDAVVNDQVWDVVIHTGKVKSDERNSKRPGRAVVYARKSQLEEVLHNNIQTDSISVEQHLQMAENQ